MKKILAAALLSLFIAAPVSYGAEPTSDISQWLRSTGSKLQSAQKKKKTDTATAGVKGAEEKAQDDLYWKDSTSSVKEEEIKSLDAAIELINAGNKPEAIKALEAFLKTFPKSPLKTDAEEGLRILKAKKK